ncbi:hypothetical protein [Kibdelosporangium phytohabitans]|nr:hypothetical protein [Kibdelosporangium phytohabitans]MBE1461850.1 hypothetical protein [Kibdelosporangium phytohabitans]
MRKLLRIAPPLVTEERALEVARRECAERGWEWREPVRVTEGLREYVIMTNAVARGGNVWMAIDIHTGAVLRASLASR